MFQSSQLLVGSQAAPLHEWRSINQLSARISLYNVCRVFLISCRCSFNFQPITVTVCILLADILKWMMMMMVSFLTEQEPVCMGES